ncbi:MAG: class I SAM-dependent methyltransferase [Candidatus Aminicenantia bacterium]
MCDNSEKTKPHIGSDHYYDITYDSKGRFVSYWHQINEIISLNPEKVLDIGIGNGFVSKYLKERGIRIITLDINKRLKPDVVGSVLEIPFANESFDVVASYELLEHLPYEDFQKALSEIYRVSNAYAILSLPDRTGKVYKFNVEIPKLWKIKRLITLPRLKALKHQFDGEHYWEIGKAGYSIKKIMSDIRNVGFDIRKTYRVFEWPYHRFFLLRKD